MCTAEESCESDTKEVILYQSILCHIPSCPLMYYTAVPCSGVSCRVTLILAETGHILTEYALCGSCGPSRVVAFMRHSLCRLHVGCINMSCVMLSDV